MNEAELATVATFQRLDATDEATCAAVSAPDAADQLTGGADSVTN